MTEPAPIVVSELRKAGDDRADPNMTAWIAGRDAAAFFLSAITVMELEIGVRRIERRDEVQGALLRAWLDDQVLREFDGRVLSVDTVVALQCARLHIPDPRSDRDALIAATALVHGMTVVTRNVADFRNMGIPLVDPWNTPAG